MTEHDPFASLDRLMANVAAAERAGAGDSAAPARAEWEPFLERIVEIADLIDELTTHCGAQDKDTRGVLPVRRLTILSKRMRAALALVDVRAMDAVGSPVDLEHHEVLATEASTEQEDVVLREVVRGYYWKDRLFRRAKVVASRGASSPPSTPSQGEP